MTEYDVKELIKKDREDNGLGVFGGLLMLVSMVVIFWSLQTAIEDYKVLKERVKQLEAQVEKK